MKLVKRHQDRVDRSSRVIVIWPENERSFDLFMTFRNQVISVGMGGVVGINYPAVYPYLDRIANGDDDWHALFSDFQEMEAAMVEQLAGK